MLPEIEISLLLWLLLPVAATSGWLAARRSLSSQAETQARKLSSDYLRGLNFLLNEQPDKAIDVFIRLIDVDSETFETHLALGVLFRRRGEVNRAIRIHQNLLARSSLNSQQRGLALLELGQDYQSAGLLDRAETSFQELLEAGYYRNFACRQLLSIYEQEHDWDKAIQIAQQLGQYNERNIAPLIANYYCEQAETAQQQGRWEQARQLLTKALQSDPACVRASLQEGALALQNQSPETAIVAFKRVETQNPLYLSEIIEPLKQCYGKSQGRLPEFRDYLYYILDKYGGITPMLELARLVREEKGLSGETEFVVRQLRARPSLRGLDHFINISLPEAKDVARDNLLLLKEITSHLLKNRPVYKCGECGFTGKTLHWQCPSCKQWNTIKPIHGIDGE